MRLKMNTLLAKAEHSVSVFKKLISEYTQFFKNKQGEFQGVRKTYDPRPNTEDEPSRRAMVRVVTTVDEKLKWLEATSAEAINQMFSIEATNASGNCKAELKVGNISFGLLSSNELMRLKSLLSSEGIEQMYANLPVRDDSKDWTLTTDSSYQNINRDRQVWETEKISGVAKSIVKREYILEDTNVRNNEVAAARYVPQKGVRDEILEKGDYTSQHFSGEATHEFRAEILRRRSQLLEAVIEALKVANEGESVESQMTAGKLFGFLHRGAIN